ncbi:MAG: ABC transporter permease [Myxococcales bacterium]|nr:ABC transporter permease [Myxococcales bacterium]
MAPLRRMLPLTGVSALLLGWSLAAHLAGAHTLPGPGKVARAIVELTERGLLLRFAVASLFRVTWGYLLAVAVAVPLGLCLGLLQRAERTLNPLLQILRPISPLAWIPLAILWFGVGDLSAIFIIFIASALPLTVTTINAVHLVPRVHLDAGRNFGLGPLALVRRVVYPAVLPQLIGGLRLALGIAWLVVVAAEMIAVNSGLGFLIIDARNAGDRYDLVVAGMVLIGLIGLVLDAGMRRLERLPSLRWGFGAARAAR